MGLFSGASDFLFGHDDQGAKDAKRELDEIKRIYDGISAPDLQWENYAPENIEYDLIQDDPESQRMQMEVLNRMGDLSQTGMSAVDEAGYNNARGLAGQVAHSGTQAAMLDAQRRGMAGSGMEFAMRAQANQQAAERAQGAALQQEADSARQRALYLSQYGQQAGQVRGQNFANNAANTNIVNRFNEANTTNRNQSQLINQQGRNDTQQQRFQNDMNVADGRSNARRAVADHGYAEDAAARDSTNQLIDIGGRVAAGVMTSGASEGARAMRKKGQDYEV